MSTKRSRPNWNGGTEPAPQGLSLSTRSSQEKSPLERMVSVLSDAYLPYLLGDHTLLMRVTTNGTVLSFSRDELGHFSLSHQYEKSKRLTEWISGNGISKKQIYERWIEWLGAGGKTIRIWYRDPQKTKPPIPLEVRSIPKSDPIHNGHTTYILLRDLSEEWSRREQARQRIRKARLQQQELLEDFALWLHDWKAPLSTIESSAWLCLRYNQEKDQEKRIRHLKRIERSIQEMKIGMQDWQTWHQPPTRRSVELLSIGPFLRERIEQMTPVLKPGQKIHLWYQGNDGIWTDPNAFRHILDNLISNASKYSPDQSPIWVRAWIKDNRVQIDIKDEGIGIPPQEIKRLFEAGYRASNSSDAPGTGLGLATVKRLVNQLGGTIEVDSQLNKGTVFSITLKNTPSYEKDLDH